ncbi:MAG: NfeD family protein [Synergistaceae bacterium]|nr:NfeD family protein [Synergistaceae bacterium]
MDYLFQFFAEGWKLWLVVSIAFMMCEGITPGAFSFFFGGLGALAAAAACYFSPSVAVSVTQQLLIFSAMSLFSLLLLRPKVMRFVHKKTRPGDPEPFIGKRAKALTELRGNGIDTGKVQFEGTEWPAEPSEGSPDIPAGSAVEIVQIEGLTLRVRLVQAETNKEVKP